MRAMQPSQTAEILRSPLELTILNLKQMGKDNLLVLCSLFCTPAKGLFL